MDSYFWDQLFSISDFRIGRQGGRFSISCRLSMFRFLSIIPFPAPSLLSF